MCAQTDFKGFFPSLLSTEMMPTDVPHHHPIHSLTLCAVPNGTVPIPSSNWPSQSFSSYPNDVPDMLKQFHKGLQISLGLHVYKSELRIFPRSQF